MFILHFEKETKWFCGVWFWRTTNLTPSGLCAIIELTHFRGTQNISHMIRMAYIFTWKVTNVNYYKLSITIIIARTDLTVKNLLNSESQGSVSGALTWERWEIFETVVCLLERERDSWENWKLVTGFDWAQGHDDQQGHFTAHKHLNVCLQHHSNASLKTVHYRETNLVKSL